MSPKPGTHLKRCKRYDVPGQAHYLTFSCFHSRPFFSGRHSPGWFLDALEAARQKHPFDLWAFVIMPEHTHLLLLPHEGVRISDILWAAKRPVTYRAIAWVQEHAPEFLKEMEERRPSGKVAHRFWQPGGGYDRNLWNARDVHEKVHYIHANPVRRGLVASPEHWDWSSWRAWETGVDEPIRIDRETFPPLVT